MGRAVTAILPERSFGSRRPDDRQHSKRQAKTADGPVDWHSAQLHVVPSARCAW